MSVRIKNPFLKLCQFTIIFGILTSFYHQILRPGDDVTRLLIPYRSEYAYALTGIFYILAIIYGLIFSKNTNQNRKKIFIFSRYHQAIFLWIVTLIFSSYIAFYTYGFELNKFGIGIIREHILALGVGMSTYYLLRKLGLRFIKLLIYSYALIPIPNLILFYYVNYINPSIGEILTDLRIINMAVDNTSRFHGFSSNPYMVSTAVLTSLISCSFIIKYFNNNKSILNIRNILIISYMFSMLPMLLATGNRIVLLQLILLLFVPLTSKQTSGFWIISRNFYKNFAKFILKYIPFLLIFVLILGFNKLQEVDSFGIISRISDDDSRLFLWRYYLSLIPNITGYGVNYEQNIGLPNLSGMHLRTTIPPHNSFLEAFMLAGIIGFFIIYKIYYYLLELSFKLPKVSNNEFSKNNFNNFQFYKFILPFSVITLLLLITSIFNGLPFQDTQTLIVTSTLVYLQNLKY